MMFPRPPSWGVLLLFGGLVACGQGSAAEVQQPIAFNHALHVGKRRFPCTDCHVGAKKQARAGLPTIRRCLLCHMRPQPPDGRPSARERVVREMAASGRPVVFKQVTRNVGHVRFSHVAHTDKMSCTTCHGDVTKWDAPPESPNEAIMDMTVCIDCHRTEGASTDCISCHE